MLDSPAIARAPSDLHRSPPTTLRAVRQRWPWLAPVALLTFLLLGAAATRHGGHLLVWDEPLTRAAVALRSSSVDRVALWVSRLGSTPVVLGAGVAGVVLAARRCRSVALVMLATVAARPLVEWFLKEMIERPRPSGARLVVGAGFSYPCGHVLAAAATWGFVPVIAALYVRRRWLWWTLTGLAGSIVVLVGWSRVWLGVHWTSDVVGSLALAFVGLSVVETVLASHRHDDPDGHDHHDHHHDDPGEPDSELTAGQVTTVVYGPGHGERDLVIGQGTAAWS